MATLPIADSHARLLDSLMRLRRAARRDLAISVALPLLGASLAWVTASLLGGRIWSPLHALPLLLAGPLLLGIAGVVWWAWHRPSLKTGARLVDQHLGLDERLATALAIGEQSGPMAAALIRDAAVHAQGASASRAFPLQRHIRSALFATGALALLGLAAALPQSTPAPAAAAFIPPGLATLRTQDQAAHDAAARNPGDPSLRRIASVLDNGLRALSQTGSAQQALAQLSHLRDQLKGLSNPSTAASAAAAAAAVKSLAGDPALQQLTSGQASLANESGNAGPLDRVAEAAQKANPAQRQQLAEALLKAASAAAGDPQLSQDLQRTAAAIRRGDTTSTQTAASAGKGRIGAIGNAQSSERARADAEAAAETAREQAARASDPSGVLGGTDSSSGGRGSGQADQGNTGKGNASGAVGNGAAAANASGTAGGQGSGTGAGLSAGGAVNLPATAGPESVFVPGVLGLLAPDGSLPPTLAPGQPVPLTNVGAVIAAFAKQELEALDRSAVSPTDRDLVHDYFSHLGAQR